MKLNKDVSHANTIINDSTSHMENDLIFTSAGQIVNLQDVVKNKNCECGDCNDCNDWVSGDIVQW